MKRSKPLRKKRVPKSLIQKLLDEAENAWKAAVARRDKGICQVHGEACTDPVKQADHFRSRRHGHTFLMIQNGTYICAGMNQAKAKGWHNADYRVGRIVEAREGRAMVDYLLESSRQTKKWTVTELEEKIKELNSLFR